MQAQASWSPSDNPRRTTQGRRSTARDGDCTYVLDGYGLQVSVERGHLVLHDGYGRERRTRRLNRATSRIRRVVLIGHSGYVTLEALRWIRDVGAAFVQIDSDGSLVTATAPERLHESRLRRAQVHAAATELGRTASIELLRVKLDRQADLCERRLSHLKSTIVRNHKHRMPISDAIREQAELMSPDMAVGELRKLESIAGRYYWGVWARVPIHFEPSFGRTVPEHWHCAGPRTSRLDRQWPRRALTPAHALLNYVYAILEAEALIAAYALGFDPSLGLMHADVRYRGSLAIDLMEPVRPIADELVLDLLEGRELRRGDVVETRRGVCRIGPALAKELTHRATDLRAAANPQAERLAAVLLGSTDHPTPLTRRRHRESVRISSARNGASPSDALAILDRQ
jgi:CRISPR-associated endonuclease Cas1